AARLLLLLSCLRHPVMRGRLIPLRHSRCVTTTAAAFPFTSHLQTSPDRSPPGGPRAPGSSSGSRWCPVVCLAERLSGPACDPVRWPVPPLHLVRSDVAASVGSPGGTRHGRERCGQLHWSPRQW